MIRNIACPWCRSVSSVRRVISLQSRRLSQSSHLAAKVSKEKEIDMSRFPVENIRNFSIIAHIDHGKSTLADRLLEITGTISSKTDNKQVLDKLQVERERGITVKAQTASILYNYNDKTYLLNLIDTPGHVDFSYEVSRSLSACQGVILLVDANQGVQAQTVANFYLAFEAGLTIIPVMNKIDLKVADPARVAVQMENLFDTKEGEIIKVSAKLGTGADEVLKKVVDSLPAPVGSRDNPLKALLFDSWYDRYRGAILNIAMVDGSVSVGDKITSAHTNKSYDVKEVGIMHPEQTPTSTLYAGQVGYVIAGMHNIKEAQIGDTLYSAKHAVTPLSGFKPAKPMVFAGMYPIDKSDYVSLRSAVDKLTLNDSSVSVSIDSSPALGQGWRLGFLGLLHMDVFNQRLEQEYNAEVIVTSPSVPYKAKLLNTKANRHDYGQVDVITITNPTLFPDRQKVSEYYEPIVHGTIITPDDYLGKVISLCLSKRGEQMEFNYIDDKRVLLKYKLPLNEIVVDFYDMLKSATSGYASFDYEDAGFEPANLVKMDILLNGKVVDELATIVHREKSHDIGKAVCERLQETIPRQLYQIAIQAAIGSRIVARENIKAMRKNVLAKCYGGDITRKMKLLKKQAEGKKKMRKIGSIEVPKEAFIAVLKR